MLFLAGSLLTEGGVVALGVIRVDGLEQPHLSVLIDGEGWENAPAGLVIISKMHMTALRSDEPLTGMELLEWAWRNRIPCAKLPLLRNETIAAKLDAEVGKGNFSVEALKLCRSCEKVDNHERLPGESKKSSFWSRGRLNKISMGCPKG